jgi:hypothetical protein
MLKTTSDAIKHWLGVALGFFLIIVCAAFPPAIPLLKPVAVKLIGATVGGAILAFLVRVEKLMAGFFLVMMVGIGLATGCVPAECKTAAHANDLKCVAVHDVIDCTKASTVKTLAEFEPLVLALVAAAGGNTGKLDWDLLSEPLFHLGIRDGSCLLAAAEEALSDRLKSVSAMPTEDGSPTVAAWRLSSLRSGFVVLRAKWGLPDGVTFRLPPRGSFDRGAF